MTDDEMRAMPIPELQDEGLLFLWVTGRAMEVGRECLRVWGYTRIDEVVWVKTNQVNTCRQYLRLSLTRNWRVFIAPACYPDGTNRALVESHQRTYASWC